MQDKPVRGDQAGRIGETAAADSSGAQDPAESAEREGCDIGIHERSMTGQGFDTVQVPSADKPFSQILCVPEYRKPTSQLKNESKMPKQLANSRGRATAAQNYNSGDKAYLSRIPRLRASRHGPLRAVGLGEHGQGSCAASYQRHRMVGQAGHIGKCCSGCRVGARQRRGKINGYIDDSS